MKWDVRPDEFKALAAPDRRRVWRRCYLSALRRPRMWGVLIIGQAAVMVALGVVLHGLPAQGNLFSWLLVRWVVISVVMGLFSIAFARYAVTLLRAELRHAATMCCLNCGYDLTGNESGTCPECGTQRRAPDRARDAEG